MWLISLCRFLWWLCVIGMLCRVNLLFVVVWLFEVSVMVLMLIIWFSSE